jgi:hypothetical protein
MHGGASGPESLGANEGLYLYPRSSQRRAVEPHVSHSLACPSEPASWRPRRRGQRRPHRPCMKERDGAAARRRGHYRARAHAQCGTVRLEHPHGSVRIADHGRTRSRQYSLFVPAILIYTARTRPPDQADPPHWHRRPHSVRASRMPSHRHRKYRVWHTCFLRRSGAVHVWHVLPGGPMWMWIWICMGRTASKPVRGARRESPVVPARRSCTGGVVCSCARTLRL